MGVLTSDVLSDIRAGVNVRLGSICEVAACPRGLLNRDEQTLGRAVGASVQCQIRNSSMPRLSARYQTQLSHSWAAFSMPARYADLYLS